MSLTYAMLSTAFAEIKDADTKRVGEIIGGKVKENIDSGIFIDCCAIRMSYALNKAGISITSADGEVSSGEDKKRYFFRVDDVENLVNKRLFITKIISKHQVSDLTDDKGIIVFRSCDWRGAHVDLYNGTKVEGKDYSNRCGKVKLYVIK